MDIVACTTAFGPSGQQKKAASLDEPKAANDGSTGASHGTTDGTPNGISSGVKETVEGVVNGVESVENGGSSEEARETREASQGSGDASASGNGSTGIEAPKENGHVVPKGLGFGLGSSARKKAENGVSDAGLAANPEGNAADETTNGSGPEGKVVKETGNGAVKEEGKAKLKGKGDAMKAMAAAEAAVRRGDREGMYPIPTLGTFYEFLSMAHLQSPLQSKCTSKFTKGYVGIAARLHS